MYNYKYYCIFGEVAKRKTILNFYFQTSQEIISKSAKLVEYKRKVLSEWIIEHKDTRSMHDSSRIFTIVRKVNIDNSLYYIWIRLESERITMEEFEAKVIESLKNIAYLTFYKDNQPIIEF